MASERQVRANRLNALKSTGPRSDDGKAKSSRNAVIHGLTSNQIVLRGEDAKLFEMLRSSLLNEFVPTTAVQMILVDQLAGIMWRLRRASVYETALMLWISHQQSRAHDDQAILLGDVFLPLNVDGLKRTATASSFSAEDILRTGRTLEAAVGKRDLLTKLSRYEAHLIRQMEKILAHNALQYLKR